MTVCFHKKLFDRFHVTISTLEQYHSINAINHVDRSWIKLYRIERLGMGRRDGSDV
jgi:hypothetical protein